MSAYIEQVAEKDQELWIDWRMRVIAVVFDGDPAAGSVDLIELRQQSAAFFSRGMKNGDLHACFARDDDGTILGCGASCTLRELPSPDNPTGRVSYLMNIFVVPEGRGRGIGEMIVQWLIDDSCGRGITRIMLESTDMGRDLYVKMGFVDTVGYMILDRRVCAENEKAGAGAEEKSLDQERT